MHRHGVAGEHGNPHAGAGHLEVGQAQDFPRFVAEFLLLIGFFTTVVDQRPGQRQCIVGNRCHVGAQVAKRYGRAIDRQFGGPVAGLGDLLRQGVHTGQPGTGHGLVGGNVQFFQAGNIVEDGQHRNDRHGGAVRVGDNALGHGLRRLPVGLHNDEGHVGVFAPGGRVIDHGGTCGGKQGSILLGGAATRGEQGNVDTAEGFLGGFRHVFYLNVLAAKLQHFAGGAFRGEEPVGVCREVAGFEDAAHFPADLASGANDCNSSHERGLLINSGP